jgi:xanthine dehydrogenase accessory factor
MTGRFELLRRAEDLRLARRPFVLATVVRAQRPTSAKAGDSALMLPDGTLDGFVGGSCAETTVRVEALRLLESGRSTLLRITPEPDDETAEEGLVVAANPCLSGGTLEIFLEAVVPPPLVYVFGDGPVARALANLGGALGYQIVGEAPAAIPADAVAVVVASHGRDEEQVLRAALRSPVPYVALVASRRRGAAVLDGLGLSADDRARVRSPAGLDIGARTAPEIALAILAEIVARRPAAPVPKDVTATDPVCGMAVAVTAQAIRLDHAGRTWYFCGSGCRDAFADAPERYV